MIFQIKILKHLRFSFNFSALCRRTYAILFSLQRTLRFNFQFESMTMEFECFQNGPFVSDSIFCFSRIDSTFVQNKILRIFEIETTLKIEKYFVNYHSCPTNTSAWLVNEIAEINIFVWPWGLTFHAFHFFTAIITLL